MLIPLEAGRDRHWAEDSLAIGSFFVPDGAVAYWSAIRAWGWTTQLPATIFLLTPRQVSNPNRLILGVRYRFIRIKPERLFGLTQIVEGALPIRLTDRERTVVDMMDRPDLCGGVGEVAAALAEGWPQLDETKLAEYVLRHGSGTVPKRLGYLAERLAIPITGRTITVLQAKTGKGITRLDRAGAASGPIVARWNLQVNAVVPNITDSGSFKDLGSNDDP
jgi:predicted transcriptional regulator of viral defense system